jgi:hypothetical protein
MVLLSGKTEATRRFQWIINYIEKIVMGYQSIAKLFSPTFLKFKIDWSTIHKLLIKIVLGITGFFRALKTIPPNYCSGLW